jgi:hypothetical protein
MRARARWVGTVAAALVVALAAQDGTAQTSGEARRVFAGGVAAANFDNAAVCAGCAERGGGGLAIGVTFGTTFADWWSVQAEGEWPTSDQTRVIQYSYGPSTVVSELKSRTPTVAVLFGVHGRASKRVDLAFQFGPSIVNIQQDSEDRTSVNGVVTDTRGYSTSDWYLTVAVGGEAAVSITPRVAVVGQLRLHLNPAAPFQLLSEAVVRPAIGVRVRF